MSGEKTTEADEELIGLDSCALRYSDELEPDGVTFHGPVAVAWEAAVRPAH
jgi:hypothetical protein